jgi:hypothetical protein
MIADWLLYQRWRERNNLLEKAEIREQKVGRSPKYSIRTEQAGIAESQNFGSSSTERGKIVI